MMIMAEHYLNGFQVLSYTRWITSVNKQSLSFKAPLLTLLLIICPYTKSNAITLKTVYDYYPVSTNTLKTLVSDVDRASPIRQNGNIYHGYTDSKLSWDFIWEQQKEYCAVISSNVKVEITITLPKLTNNQRPEIIQVWEKWYPELLNHELNHKQHAINIGEELETAISKFYQKGTCIELEKTINETGYTLIKKLQELGREYDLLTNHGETEGAKLSTHLTQ